MHQTLTESDAFLDLARLVGDCHESITIVVSDAAHRIDWFKT